MTQTGDMKIYDISRTLSPDLAVWPGDISFSFAMSAKLSEGASVNLTRLNFSAHTGTHADAPFHYNDEGIHPSALPLERYVGPAHVVSIEREHGGIVPSDFDHYDFGDAPIQRLLIHTRYSDIPDHEWDVNFPYPTVELIDWLAEKGVFLLGVDMPSVDKSDSKDLPSHHRLDHHDIYIIELLQLRDISDGKYELVALPLKIDDVCGSPVRAILREMK